VKLKVRKIQKSPAMRKLGVKFMGTVRCSSEALLFSRSTPEVFDLGGSGKMALFSSHPPLESRIAALEAAR
jgi:Zn-dependent protease with chaperone function